MLAPIIISFLLLLLLGLPVGFALLSGSLIAFLFDGGIPIATLTQRMIVGVNNYSLLAIPLFVMAGTLMNSGGITIRLIRLAEALVGHIRGSIGHVTVLSNMFMSGVSGSGVADASATGSTLIPIMIKKGYSRGFSSAVLSASATIGPIIPPSIPMIVFGGMAGVSIGKLFLGGAIPGIIMGFGLMFIVYLIATKRKMEKSSRASIDQILKAFKDAIWALIMPLIIVGGILSGVFTATESAAIAVVYASFVGFFIYKELKLRDIPNRLVETLILTAIIGIIIASASPFGWIMAFEKAPEKLFGLLQVFAGSDWLILLMIMVALLIMGCFLEGAAIIIITTPVVLPMVMQIGIDPVHYGVLLAVNTMIGTITPPLGVLMYVTNSIAKASISEFMREVFPLLLMLIALLLLFAYVPEIVMFLPNLLMD